MKTETRNLQTSPVFFLKYLFSSFLMLIISATYSQSTIYVNASATGANSGESWTNAYTDFQNAINNANSGDSVFVAGGTYQPSSGKSFSMQDGVKIYGGFAGTESSLSQRDLSSGDTSILKGNGNRVIDNSKNNLDNSALLDGFTVTGGRANQGGGMYNANSSPSLNNVIFIANTALISRPLGGMGGGMSNNQMSNPVLSKVQFINNVSQGTGTYVGKGGGMYNTTNSNPSLTNVIFSGNTAQAGGSGGGMYNNVNCNAQLNNVAFIGNTAQGGGGFAPSGGAIYSSDASGGSTILNNVTFSKDSCNGGTAGLYT
jgi:hypothetical protein